MSVAWECSIETVSHSIGSRAFPEGPSCPATLTLLYDPVVLATQTSCESLSLRSSYHNTFKKLPPSNCASSPKPQQDFAARAEKVWMYSRLKRQLLCCQGQMMPNRSQVRPRNCVITRAMLRCGGLLSLSVSE